MISRTHFMVMLTALLLAAPAAYGSDKEGDEESAPAKARAPGSELSAAEKEQADAEAAKKKRILEALLLPTKATQAREEGVSEADVEKAVRSAKDVGPGQANRDLEDKARTAKKAAPPVGVDNPGGAPKTKPSGPVVTYEKGDDQQLGASPEEIARRAREAAGRSGAASSRRGEGDERPVKKNTAAQGTGKKSDAARAEGDERPVTGKPPAKKAAAKKPE